jgi:hypothetical protein
MYSLDFPHFQNRAIAESRSFSIEKALSAMLKLKLTTLAEVA